MLDKLPVRAQDGEEPSDNEIVVNVGLLFSLTRSGEGGPGDLVGAGDGTSFIINLATTLALINQLNDQLEETPTLQPTIIEKNYNCNVRLNPVVMDSQSDFSVAMSAIDPTINSEDPLDVLISHTRSSTCVPVSFVTSTSSLPVLSSSCTSPELDNPEVHRFFARTIPSDAEAAQSIVELLKALPSGDRNQTSPLGTTNALGYKRAVVMYEEGVYGSNFKDEVFERAEDIILELIPFRSESNTSIIGAVEAAADTEFNVIICIVFPDDIKEIMQAAKEFNVAGADRLWIFSDGLLGAGDIRGSLDPTDTEQEVEIMTEEDQELLTLFNNSFVVLATGEVPSEENEALLAAFRTNVFDPDYGYLQEQLNEILDDLYTENVASDLKNKVAAMFVEKPEINDFSLFAYDAALAIREVYEAHCRGNLDGGEFISTLRNDAEGANFSYDGITGRVQFDSGLESNSRSTSSASMKLINIRFTSQYDALDIDAGVYSGGEWMLLPDLRFNDGSSIAPLEVQLPDEVNQRPIEGPVKDAVYGIAASLLVATILLTVFVCATAENEIMQAAQPSFLLIMLIGVVVSTSSVFLLYREPIRYDDLIAGISEEALLADIPDNDLNCNIPFHLLTLGLTLSYAALIFKLKNLILVAQHPKTLRNHNASLSASYKGLAFVLALNVAIGVLLWNVAYLKYTEEVIEYDDFEQKMDLYNVCANERAYLFGLYGFLYAGLLGYGIKLIIQVRNLSTDFQEGKWISVTLLGQLQLSLLGFPVLLAIGPEDPTVQYLVSSLLIILSNTMMLILIFGPKFMRMYSGERVAYEPSNSKFAEDMEDRTVHESGDRTVRVSLTNTLRTEDFAEGSPDDE